MAEPTALYQILDLGPLQSWEGKSFGRDLLGLSASQVSFNRFPAGQAAPFVHDHRTHEELYVVLQGGGLFYLDGQELPVKEGSLIRVNPGVQRAWQAGADGITFICTQTKSGSMPEPKGDGIRLPDVLPSWAKAS